MKYGEAGEDKKVQNNRKTDGPLALQAEQPGEPALQKNHGEKFENK